MATGLLAVPVLHEVREDVNRLEIQVRAVCRVCWRRRDMDIYMRSSSDL